MNVIRATLNKKSSRPRRGKFHNVPTFQTYFQRPSGVGTSDKSLLSSSEISSLQQLNFNQVQVLGTAERNSSSSHSTEQAFRTPSLSYLKKKSVTSDPQISNEFVAECLNTPDVPPTTDSSNSKISVRQKELLRNIQPLCLGGSGRKPRSSTSSGARPRTTPSHSNSGTPRTPRTPKTTSSLESAQNIIIAITEGRGLARGEVGMAAIDTHRPYLILCQISDCQTYASTLTKINVLHPTEILVPNTFIESQEKNKLFTLIHENFPQVSIVTVQRRHYSDTTGLQQVQSLCLTECANVEMVVRQKFYTLSAAAALLKYIEFQKNIIFMPKSLRIDYQSPENVMSIDMKTAQKLELVMSMNRRGSEGSLLGVLDHCCTVGGKRSLRANILQPPTKLDIINSRLLSVTELAQNPALLHSLQSAVSMFCGAEQLLWLCVQVPNFKDEKKASELQTNFVLLLKATLESLTVLRESLQSAQTPFFRKVLKDLDNENFGLMLTTILEVVNEDAKTKKGFAASTFQRCFAIKTGINGLLDLSRASYSELVTRLHDRVREMAEEFGLDLRTGTTSNKGFHIQLSIKRHMKFSAKDLPKVFIQVARTRNLITMTTEELVLLNHRIKDILLQIQIMSNVIMQELLRKLRTNISCLYCLCENISELDLLISFSQVSSADNFVPPTFGSKMEINSSRHPILDVVSSSTPVANGVFASSEKNFHIITGPNMGGKSIYIKQVALLQVMAQMGCFVPAESAELRITKRILSRIGFDDSIEYNASSFVMEMQEMQYILRSLGPDSLVIIDELCRSTDSEEGTAVAWVLCEQLLQSKAFVFFTTHYLTLTKLQSLYPNVTNHQMVAENGRSGRLVYTHKLRPGVTKVAMYGLRLAELSALPASVLQRARELCTDLAAERLEGPVHDEEKTEAEEDQEYIQELVSLIEDNKFNITELSNVQEKLRKRYGIDGEEEHLESSEKDLVEITTENEKDEDNSDAIDNGKGPGDPKSPMAITNIPIRNRSSKDSPYLNTSNKSPCVTPRTLPLCPTSVSPVVPTGSKSPILNKLDSPNHFLDQEIPNVHDISCMIGNPTELQSSFKDCDVNLNEQIKNIPHLEFTTSQNENLSRRNTPLTTFTQNSLGIEAQNLNMVMSPYFAGSNTVVDNSTTANQNFAHQKEHAANEPCNLFELEIELPVHGTKNKSSPFPNPNIRSQNAVPPQKTNTSLIPGYFNLEGDKMNYHCEFGCTQLVPISPNEAPRNTSPSTFNEHLDYNKKSQTLSPILDEYRHSQLNRLLSEQISDCREAIGSSHSPQTSSGLPGPKTYPRASSTPGRLSSRIPSQSPLSTQSHTSMVLSLIPSFDVVPRNLNSGDTGLSDSDDNFEE